MKAQKIVVLGAGGLGRETLTLINAVNRRVPTWEFLGFIDENPEAHGEMISGVPVLGGLEWFKDYHGVEAVCAIGGPAVKKAIVLRAEKLGVKFAVVQHPTVELAGFVELSDGDIICANTVLTDLVYVGHHVIINLACTIGHDVSIGDYCTLAPGVHVSGHDVLGDGVEVGTGAVFVQGVEVGAGSIIGAGAVVVDDIPEGVVAVGVPARPIKKVVPVE